MTQESNLPANVQWDVAPIPKGPAGRISLAANDGWSIWRGGKAIVNPKLINDSLRDGKTAIEATIKEVAQLVIESQK